MRESAAVWTCTEFAIDGDTIWFVPNECCFLIQYDFVKKSVCRKVFLEKSTSFWGSHYCVLRVEQYIVAAPGTDNHIYFYDDRNQILKSVPLPKKEGVREYFRKCATWNGQIFFFPSEYQNIVKINLFDFSVEEIPVPYQENTVHPAFIRITNAFQRGKLVDMCMNGSNAIFRFDMETYAGMFFYLKNLGKYRAICSYEENDVLLITEESRGVICDENYKQIKEFDFPENNSGYVDCVRYKEGYIFIPYKNKDSLLYWENDIFRVIGNAEEIDEETEQSWIYNDYSEAKVVGEKVLLFNVPKKSLLVIDMNEYRVESQKVEIGKVNENDKRELLSLFKERFTQFDETDFWSLSSFIEVLKEGKHGE